MHWQPLRNMPTDGRTIMRWAKTLCIPVAVTPIRIGNTPVTHWQDVATCDQDAANAGAIWCEEQFAPAWSPLPDAPTPTNTAALMPNVEDAIAMGLVKD